MARVHADPRVALGEAKQSPGFVGFRVGLQDEAVDQGEHPPDRQLAAGHQVGEPCVDETGGVRDRARRNGWRRRPSARPSGRRWPAITADHSRGWRCCSSTASRIRNRAVVSGMPNAAPTSMARNSPTPGVPVGHRDRPFAPGTHARIARRRRDRRTVQVG